METPLPPDADPALMRNKRQQVEAYAGGFRAVVYSALLVIVVGGILLTNALVSNVNNQRSRDYRGCLTGAHRLAEEINADRAQATLDASVATLQAAPTVTKLDAQKDKATLRTYPAVSRYTCTAAYPKVHFVL